MEYIIFRKERMPKSRILAFKPIYKTENSSPYLNLIKDRKICVESFNTNVELTEQVRYLKEVYKDFVELGEWVLSKSIIRSYKPKIDKNNKRYSIIISSPYINDLRIIFKTEDDMNDVLLKMDEMFNVIW